MVSFNFQNKSLLLRFYWRKYKRMTIFVSRIYLYFPPYIRRVSFHGTRFRRQAVLSSSLPFDLSSLIVNHHCAATFPLHRLLIVNNCIILSHRSRRQGSWVGDDMMEKAFAWRFGFDSVELRNFYKMSLKTKQRWMSHGYVSVLLCYISRDDSYNS